MRLENVVEIRQQPKDLLYQVCLYFFCLHFLKFSLRRISEFDLVVVDGSQSFEGTGASKKLAKQACARYVLISHKKYIFVYIFLFAVLFIFRMALTALYNLSFTPGMETGNEEKGALDDKDQLVPGMYIFRYCVGIIHQVFLNLDTLPKTSQHYCDNLILPH